MNRSFFERSVHEVARELIGCELRVGETAGVIVETEAYEESDPACHAYIGRTARDEVLFGPPGHAYVYLSYGIHSLLNFVTEPEGCASAVLIRALEPTDGIELMRERRGRGEIEQLCSGPGKLSEALGVGLTLNGADLFRPPFDLSQPDRAIWRRDHRLAADRDHEGRGAALALQRRGQSLRLAALAACFAIGRSGRGR